MSNRQLEEAGENDVNNLWVCHLLIGPGVILKLLRRTNSASFSFQLTVEMFDYLECELNLFLNGKLFWLWSLPPAVFVWAWRETPRCCPRQSKVMSLKLQRKCWDKLLGCDQRSSMNLLEMLCLLVFTCTASFSRPVVNIFTDQNESSDVCLGVVTYIYIYSSVFFSSSQCSVPWTCLARCRWQQQASAALPPSSKSSLTAAICMTTLSDCCLSYIPVSDR